LLSRGLVPRSERARLSRAGAAATTLARACSGTISRYKVGSRARRGERVRGSCLPHLWMLRGRQDAPHPDPLPASGAREYRAALIHECFLHTFANLCNQVLGHQTIAARLGHQDLGTRRIAFDLLAKAIHMGFQRVGGYPGIVAPHLTEERIAPDRPIASPIEVF
jgi:hypothetical protein